MLVKAVMGWTFIYLSWFQMAATLLFGRFGPYDYVCKETLHLPEGHRFCTCGTDDTVKRCAKHCCWEQDKIVKWLVQKDSSRGTCGVYSVTTKAILDVPYRMSWKPNPACTAKCLPDSPIRTWKSGFICEGEGNEAVATTKPISTKAVATADSISTQAVDTTESISTHADDTTELLSTQAVITTELISTKEMDTTYSISTQVVDTTESISTKAGTSTESKSNHGDDTTEPISTKAVDKTENISAEILDTTESISKPVVDTTDTISSESVNITEITKAVVTTESFSTIVVDTTPTAELPFSANIVNKTTDSVSFLTNTTTNKTTNGISTVSALVTSISPKSNSLIENISTNTFMKCPCACIEKRSRQYRLTQEYVTEEVKKIQEKLIVQTKNLSASVRKKTSAKDERPSAQISGTLGIIIFCLVCVCLVATDLTRLW